jgi:hypothetical protein
MAAPSEDDNRSQQVGSGLTRLTVAGLVIAVFTNVTGACANTALPPKLTSSQRDAIARSQRWCVTVGVEPFRFPVYSDRLLTALIATHLFARVDVVEAFSTPPTFVARVERSVYGTATLPWLTGLSLGFIPTIVEEEHGYAFSLIPSAASDQHIQAGFIYKGASTLGWWALYLNLFRDGTSKDVYGHPRLREALAWTIVEHRERICRYAGVCCGPAR